MHIFYSADINDLFLGTEDSRHCARVLRLRPGDVIGIIDGNGTYAEASITGSSDKCVEYSILSLIPGYNPLPYQLTILIAPTRNVDRFEWFVEKATEIGVTRIVPVICEKSERKSLNDNRLAKIVISAAKQSRKATFPIIEKSMPFVHAIGQYGAIKGAKLIAHCHDKEKVSFHTVKDNVNDIVICIGPEGDFTLDEITKAVNVGFMGLDMGKNRLRTETAGVFACSAINLLTQK